MKRATDIEVVMRPPVRIGRAVALLTGLVMLFGASLTASAYEIWVTNQRTDRIQILTGTSLRVVDEIPAGEKPHNITFSKDGKTAYVANLRSNNVTVVDAIAKRYVATIPAGKTTHYVAISPDQSLLLVVNRGDETITVVEAASLKQLAVLPVGKRPNMAVFTPDGKRAYVSNSGDGSLSILDAQTLTVSETIRGVGRDISSIAITPDGRKLVVIATGEDKYLMIDTATRRPIAQGSTGRDPRSLALTPDGGQVVIVNRVSNSLTVVDVRSGQVTDTITEVGDKPSSIALSADGRRAFVVLIGERAPEDPPQRLSGKDAAVAVIDLANRRKITTVRLGGDPYAIGIRE
jgi:YVTN family beta-propeller protein